MSIQRHPVDSLDKKLNFWEEFPDYKIHPVLGDIWKLNRKTVKQKKDTSNLMWVLSLCYDRKSSFFNQPELDKWEVTSLEYLDDQNFMRNLVEGEPQDRITLPTGLTGRLIISSFEDSIDTPLGINLRRLEAKLVERTDFIMKEPYTLDGFETSSNGRQILKKGSADQLDKMFTNTEKISSLIQTAMATLKSSGDSNKGGGNASLSDGSTNF